MTHRRNFIGELHCHNSNSSQVWLGIYFFILISFCAPAVAQGRTSVTQNDVSAKILLCRQIVDVTGRLACYDGLSDRLRAAIAAGSVKVVDQQALQEADRKTFGLTGVARGARPDDRLRAIESKITALSAIAGGAWDIALADGSVWRTVAGLSGRIGVGTSVTVTRDQFGRYKMAPGEGRKTIVYRIR